MAEFHDDSTAAFSSLTGDSDYQTTAATASKVLGTRIPLSGRTSERSKLFAVFGELFRSGESQVVVVHGSSGTGKSTLIYSLQDTIIPPDLDSGHLDAWFVSGKFEQYSGRNDPFSAVISAVADLIDLIAQNGLSPVYQEETKKAIKGFETTFASLIPNLTLLTGTDYEISSLRTHAMVFLQFKAAFVELLLVLARRERPLVMFLDDLQWMDDASLSLLQSIMSQSSSKHFLLIGAIRDGDPRTPHVLESLYRQDTDEQASPKGLSVTYIKLENLNIRSVSQMVSSALGLPIASCSSLGCLVHQKTMGNPFAVLRFLDLIESEGLISRKNGSWIWDENKIKAETSLSDNVLEVVERILHHLPEEAKELLVLAAFLGFEFNDTALTELALHVREQTSDNKIQSASKQEFTRRCPELLSEACQKDIVLEVTPATGQGSPSHTKYKFSHDKIQQALYDSIPTSESHRLHRTIGLYVRKTSCASDELAFDIANHLNRAEPIIAPLPHERPLLVQVNFEAAKLAIFRAAYPTAVQYLQLALGAQDPNLRWKKDYKMTLEMSTLLSRMYAACGQDQDVEPVIDEVLRNARCLDDMLPVMSTKVCVLGSSSRFGDAVEYGLKALNKLGEKIPRKPNVLQLLMLLAKARRQLRRRGDSDIMTLPRVTNGKTKAVLRIYTRVGAYAVMLRQQELSMFCMLRATCLSFVHGIATATPIALCFLGFAEFAFGDICAAVRCGRLAVRMVDELALEPEAIAQTYSVGVPNLLHWFEPCDDHLAKLARYGMEKGIGAGEFEYGFYSGAMILILESTGGVPLRVLERHCREICSQMKEFSVQSNLHLALPYWQYCLNLMGYSERSATVLAGDAIIDEQEFRQNPAVKGKEVHEAILNTLKLQLCVFFGAFDEAEKLASLMEKEEKAVQWTCIQYDLKLSMALAWYNSARRATGKGAKRRRIRNLRKARNVVKYMKHMKSSGCPNFDDCLLLLEAEDASFSKEQDHDLIKSLYDAAILAAGGKLHHEAIANELAARYHIEQHQGMLVGTMYMDCAMSKYREWNARAKVDDMQEKISLFERGNQEEPFVDMTLDVPRNGQVIDNGDAFND